MAGKLERRFSFWIEKANDLEIGAVFMIETHDIKPGTRGLPTKIVPDGLNECLALPHGVDAIIQVANLAHCSDQGA